MFHQEKPTILVVDDVWENLFLIEQLIRRLNVNIITAESGETALNKVKGKELFLALLDIRTQGMGGIELARRLLNDKSRDLVPVIFITTFQDEKTIEKCYEVGGVDFIIKPVQPLILTGKVKIFLDLYLQKVHIRESHYRLEQTEKELKRSMNSLQELTRHLEEVREDERKKIAMDLHDDLGQMITAINMDLAWLGRNVPDGLPHLTSKIASTRELLNETIQKVQKISAGLRPGMLDILGLIPAIRWQINEFKKSTGIRCYTKITPDQFDIDPALSIIIFRLVQEALTNVTRHAEASKLRLELLKVKENIFLTINDNGKGIPLAALEDKHSYGIAGMKDRVSSCGGNISFGGKPGKGTNIKINIPIKSVEE